MRYAHAVLWATGLYSSLSLANPSNGTVTNTTDAGPQDSGPGTADPAVPAAPKLPYGLYQNEIFRQGAKGLKPAVTTDPNKLEDQAKGKLTAKAYAFLAGGSGERATMDANRLAFRQWKLFPRILSGPGKTDLGVTILGKKYPTPILMAPIGFMNLFHADAEPGAASVAADLGIPYVMSMSSSATIENVAKANGNGERWFQLYWPPSDFITLNLLKRAQASGFRVLVVTLDVVSLGWRPWDLDQGYMPDNFSGQKNVSSSGLGFGSSDLFAAGLPPLDQLFSPPPSWERIKFLKQNWAGPIVLKGIQHVDDAKKAAAAGIDGIIVSNHGGRQLDGGIASLDALPEIVDAVGDKVTVLFDSGVRTGADVIKALSLGAKGVLVGRPWAYGLGVAGKDGVRQVLRGFLADLEINMNIAGLKKAEDFKRSILRKVPYAGCLDQN